MDFCSPIIVQRKSGDIRSCCFSPDGRFLATVQNMVNIAIYSVPEPTTSSMSFGNAVVILTGHTDKIKSLRFSGNGHKMVSASYDKTIRVWDTSSLSASPLQQFGTLTL